MGISTRTVDTTSQNTSRRSTDTTSSCGSSASTRRIRRQHNGDRRPCPHSDRHKLNHHLGCGMTCVVLACMISLQSRCVAAMQHSDHGGPTAAFGDNPTVPSQYPIDTEVDKILSSSQILSSPFLDAFQQQIHQIVAEYRRDVHDTFAYLKEQIIQDIERSKRELEEQEVLEGIDGTQKEEIEEGNRMHQVEGEREHGVPTVEEPVSPGAEKNSISEEVMVEKALDDEAIVEQIPDSGPGQHGLEISTDTEEEATPADSSSLLDPRDGIPKASQDPTPSVVEKNVHKIPVPRPIPENASSQTIASKELKKKKKAKSKTKKSKEASRLSDSATEPVSLTSTKPKRKFSSPTIVSKEEQRKELERQLRQLMVDSDDDGEYPQNSGSRTTQDVTVATTGMASNLAQKAANLGSMALMYILFVVILKIIGSRLKL